MRCLYTGNLTFFEQKSPCNLQQSDGWLSRIGTEEHLWGWAPLLQGPQLSSDHYTVNMPPDLGQESDINSAWYLKLKQSPLGKSFLPGKRKSLTPPEILVQRSFHRLTFLWEIDHLEILYSEQLCCLRHPRCEYYYRTSHETLKIRNLGVLHDI